MKREREGNFSIKGIANFDVGKIPGFLLNGNAGTVFLMILAATCHRFRGIHPILENGSVFLVFLGFLSLVVVEGKNLVSKWNKSGKRGFLTLGSIIGLVFLGVLLAVGMYTTFIIFYVKDFLTIDFLGIFGIIWTLRWIQKLKNFSSTRDNVHKLIGPLIAIIILISGYALHSKNTAFGPFSCVLAPATIWIFSLIFGDIKGRSNDQDDEINPFAIIISIILLGLVIYAIRDPTIYGIQVMDIDGEFFKDLYVAEKKSLSSVLEAKRLHLINQTRVDIKESIEKLETIGKDIDDLNKDLPSAQEQLENAQREFEKAQKELTSKEQAPYGLLVKQIEKNKGDIGYKEQGIQWMINRGYGSDHPEMKNFESEKADMVRTQKSLESKMDALKRNDNFKTLEQELMEADDAAKAAKLKMEEASAKIDDINSQIQEKTHKSDRVSFNNTIKSEELKNLEDTTKLEDTFRKISKENPHFGRRVEKLEKLKDTYIKSKQETATESTIISWLRRIFGNNKKTNVAK